MPTTAAPAAAGQRRPPRVPLPAPLILLARNTRLTETIEDLTERLDGLTREVHQHLCAGR